jgi:hypothetical protein
MTPTGLRTLTTIVLCGFAGMAASQTADSAKDRIRLDETVISGNQELPKVLYILPWQSPEGRPELDLDTGLRDSDVFRRVYPPAYRRELRYHEDLRRTQSQAQD